MLTSKGVFSKKFIFPAENSCFLKSQGSNYRSKINIKSNAETERLGNPMLIDFGIDVEIASNFDHF